MRTVIYLDTNVFISAFETEGPRSEAMWAVLTAIERGDFDGVTGELTLAELLPKPLSLGQLDLRDVYLELLSGERNIDVVPVTRPLLIETAVLRSHHHAFKLPDAVHLVTAQSRGYSVMLSDDRRLPLPPHMRHVRVGPDSLRSIRQADQ